MITAHTHNTSSGSTPVTQCHDITSLNSGQNLTVTYTNTENNVQTYELAPNATITICALVGSVSVPGEEGKIYTMQIGSVCDFNYECESYNTLYLTAGENSGSDFHGGACNSRTIYQVYSLDIQNLSQENLTSLIGKQIFKNNSTHTVFNGGLGGTPWSFDGYYGISSAYGYLISTGDIVVRIDKDGYITAAAYCAAVSPTPTPTPSSSSDKVGGGGPVLVTPTPTPSSSATPTPTPSSSRPAIMYKYIMNPCDETSANFTARSNSPKTIGNTYTCTGSAYAEDNYTVIATSTNAWVTWIGDLTVCSGGDGEPIGCLLSGTQIEMHDGTSKNIEDIVIGDAVMSRSIATAPDSDNKEQLLEWSHVDPKIGTDLAQVTDKMAYWKTEIYNINSGLLRSSATHVHFIKRGDSYRFIEAKSIQVGDFLIDKANDLVEITSVVKTHGNYQVWKLDVESLDTYIANGIVTHNDKRP